MLAILGDPNNSSPQGSTKINHKKSLSQPRSHPYFLSESALPQRHPRPVYPRSILRLLSLLPPRLLSVGLLTAELAGPLLSLTSLTSRYILSSLGHRSLPRDPTSSRRDAAREAPEHL